jgi:predicted nucleic acid-binding protein
MPTSAELALVDTNVLVESLYKSAPHHDRAVKLLDRAQSGEVALCAFPQVFGEFYSVVTDKRRTDPVMSPAQALDAIDTFLVMPGLSLLPLPPDVLQRWLALARRAAVKGGQIFDLQLIAAMIESGITRVFTFNREDFREIRRG